MVVCYNGIWKNDNDSDLFGKDLKAECDLVFLGTEEQEKLILDLEKIIRDLWKLGYIDTIEVVNEIILEIIGR
jgi:hypothetical protein